MITQSFYNQVVKFIEDSELYIKKLYSDMQYIASDSEKMIFLEEINDYRVLIAEYTKYKIIYETQKKDDDVLDEVIVIEGDTLQSIAAKKTGSHTNWQRLYDFNGLSDIYLSAGDTIKIPRDLLNN